MTFDAGYFGELQRRAHCSLGGPCYHRPETGSTNDDARSYAQQGGGHGALFVADAQTHGRGRHGKTWVARSGEGLLFSIVLVPPRAVDEWTALPLAAGLALLDALQPFSEEELGVKWPNDLLCAEGKKLAGVLVEAELSRPHGPSAILGIGLNIEAEAFEEGLNATSLALLTRAPLPRREQLLVDILLRLAHWLERFFAEGVDALVPALNRHDALKGRRLRVGDVEGVAAGIDRLGRLRLQTTDGITPVAAGTVIVL